MQPLFLAHIQVFGARFGAFDAAVLVISLIMAAVLMRWGTRDGAPRR